MGDKLEALLALWDFENKSRILLTFSSSVRVHLIVLPPVSLTMQAVCQRCAFNCNVQTTAEITRGGLRSSAVNESTSICVCVCGRSVRCRESPNSNKIPGTAHALTKHIAVGEH